MNVMAILLRPLLTSTDVFIVIPSEPECGVPAAWVVSEVMAFVSTKQIYSSRLMIRNSV